MAVRVFLKAGVDAHWATVGNWNVTGGTHDSTPGVPETGDAVYLTGATAPDTAPAAITLIRFDTTELTATPLVASISQNITISDGGVVLLGAQGSTKAHNFIGIFAESITTSYHIYGQGENNSDMSPLLNAYFHDDARQVDGKFATNNYFYDDSLIMGHEQKATASNVFVFSPGSSTANNITDNDRSLNVDNVTFYIYNGLSICLANLNVPDSSFKPTAIKIMFVPGTINSNGIDIWIETTAGIGITPEFALPIEFCVDGAIRATLGDA